MIDIPAGCLGNTDPARSVFQDLLTATMPIQPIQITAAPQIGTVKIQPSKGSIFSSVMALQDSKPDEAKPESVASPPGPSAAPISLGTISKQFPSISHLLINHSDLHDRCWEIIHHPINNQKQFTGIRVGTEVYFDPQTQEITWGPGNNNSAGTTQTLATDQDESPTSDRQLPAQIVIGSIDEQHPTLSQLLKSNLDFADRTWDIIFSAANRYKPYTQLRPGCTVSINSKTLELTFQYGQRDEADQKTLDSEQVPYCLTRKESAPPVGQGQRYDLFPSGEADKNTFSEQLVRRVKSYLGQPYGALDCYELVIKGLEDLGVEYGGENGLQQRLTRMAVGQGLPVNAYHNGEGLIAAGGSAVYDRSFPPPKDPKRESAYVMDALRPVLKEGMLLSFSTKSQGHTGVISSKNGEWTFINSGLIDHQVDGGKSAKRVGEEALSEEIRNWFTLAGTKGSSLKINVGIFEPDKLKAGESFAQRNLPNPPVTEATSRSRLPLNGNQETRS